MTTPTRFDRFGQFGIIAAGIAVGVALFAAPAHAGSIGDRSFTPSIGGLDRPCDDEAFGQYVCSPDFVASSSTMWTFPTMHDGELASFFYLSISNEALGTGDTVFTSVGVNDGEIIDIEQWYGADATAAPVAKTNDMRWMIEHDGLDKDEVTSFRVWVADGNSADFTVETNRPDRGGALREVTRSNNITTGSL